MISNLPLTMYLLLVNSSQGIQNLHADFWAGTVSLDEVQLDST